MNGSFTEIEIGHVRIIFQKTDNGSLYRQNAGKNEKWLELERQILILFVQVSKKLGTFF